MLVRNTDSDTRKSQIDDTSIGERITRMRKARNLTQQQLADATGFGRGQVAKWENGLSELSPNHTMALADFFDVSCDYLLRGYEKEDLPLGKKLHLSQKSLDGLASLTDPEQVSGRAFAHFLERLHEMDDIGSMMYDAVELLTDYELYREGSLEDEDLGLLKSRRGNRIEKKTAAYGIINSLAMGMYCLLCEGARMEAKEYAEKEQP